MKIEMWVGDRGFERTLPAETVAAIEEWIVSRGLSAAEETPAAAVARALDLALRDFVAGVVEQRPTAAVVEAREALAVAKAGALGAARTPPARRVEEGR